MYSQEELTQAQKTFSRFVWGYAGAAVIFLALIVLICVVRLPVWLYVLLVLFPAGSVFIWDLYGRRMMQWRNFLNDMLTGLERENTGIIEEIESQPVDKKGLQYLRLHILSGDMPEKEDVGRIYYYELSRPPLAAKAGDHVSFITSDRYIKRITILEEKA